MSSVIRTRHVLLPVPSPASRNPMLDFIILLLLKTNLILPRVSLNEILFSFVFGFCINGIILHAVLCYLLLSLNVVCKIDP